MLRGNSGMPSRFTRTEDSNLLRLRKSEKAKLWARFCYSIIESIYRDKLLALFGTRCFKCGGPPPLDIDHHVPLALGGQLIPGNLVALSPRCNGIKLDCHPENFYSAPELERLAPLLELQKALFELRFDEEAWESDENGYLIKLGLPPHEAWSVFKDPNHRYFMGDYPEPESSEALDIDDKYRLIRPMLEDYKTELQVLLALAKPLNHMSEASWQAILEFFKSRNSSFSPEQERMLKQYVKNWGPETDDGFRVRCNQLEISPDRQGVYDDLIRIATTIVGTQPSDAWNARLDFPKQRLISSKPQA